MVPRSPRHNFALLQACYDAADDGTASKNLPAGALVLLRGGDGLGSYSRRATDANRSGLSHWEQAMLKQGWNPDRTVPLFTGVYQSDH